MVDIPVKVKEVGKQAIKYILALLKATDNPVNT